MQDRVSLYPGRVKLTPVAGQENTYDMVRADSPTQEGTPLNKANLLTDATAALFGLGTDAVPNEVLGVLSRLHSGLGNEYLWAKYKSTYTNSFYWVNKSDLRIGSTGYSTSFTYSSSVTINDDGNAELVNPTTSSAQSASAFSVLKGKYFIMSTTPIVTPTAPGGLKFAPDSTSFSVSSGWISIDTYQECSLFEKIEARETTFLNSTNRNAYATGTFDGYTYEFLGQLGEKSRVSQGRYVGTGTYGSNNQCSLTFEFSPKFLFITSSNNNLFLYAMIGQATSYSSSSGANTFLFSGNTVSWYSTTANSQLNAVGTVYYYIAIG